MTPCFEDPFALTKIKELWGEGILILRKTWSFQRVLKTVENI